MNTHATYCCIHLKYVIRLYVINGTFLIVMSQRRTERNVDLPVSEILKKKEDTKHSRQVTNQSKTDKDRRKFYKLETLEID